MRFIVPALAALAAHAALSVAAQANTKRPVQLVERYATTSGRPA